MLSWTLIPPFHNPEVHSLRVLHPVILDGIALFTTLHHPFQSFLTRILVTSLNLLEILPPPSDRVIS